MNRMKQLSTIAAQVSAMTLALSLGSGCGALNQLLAERATDSGEMGSVESSLLATATEDADSTMTPGEAAQEAALRANERFGSDCVTATVADESVSFQLDQCTGRYGLVTVSGTIDVLFGETSEGLLALANSDDLDVNGGHFVLDAEGLLVADGDTRTWEIVTNSAGTSARGNAIERAGDYVVSVDRSAGCVALDGSWETVVDTERGWDTTVSGLERCEETCPSAGGRVDFVGRLRGNAVTVAFDGSDVASWESTTGDTGTVDLACD